MKYFAFIALCIIILASCSTSHKATENNDAVRWPDFLRDWAADYEIDDARQVAVIDQIDTLYRLVEDSTSDSELLCTKLCQLQGTISDAIMHDSSLAFSLMMRATARNFNGVIYRNPWLLERECPCEVFDYSLLDAQWYTSSREHFDIMYYTFIGLSWEAPDRFANLMLGKDDGSELTMATLVVYNYADTVIDNLQITFTDKDNVVLERLTENDMYVDLTDVGIKSVSMPPYLVMSALTAGGTMTVSYSTPHGTLEMVGFPHMFFMEQIEDCPRLKEILYKALDEKQ